MVLVTVGQSIIIDHLFLRTYCFAFKATEKIGKFIFAIRLSTGSTSHPTPFGSRERMTRNGNTTKKILEPIPLK